MAGTSPSRWTILLDTGPRLRTLPGLLTALVRADQEGAEDSSQGARVAQLEDLDVLFDPPSSRGRVVLDADTLAPEDLGLVRRFLDREAGWSLLLVGTRATTEVVRSLRAHPRAQYWSWPLDVEELESLLVPRDFAADAPDQGDSETGRAYLRRDPSTLPSPRARRRPQPGRTPGGHSTAPPGRIRSAAGPSSPEIRQIEAILEAEGGPPRSSVARGVGKVSGSLALVGEEEPFDDASTVAAASRAESSDDLEITFTPEDDELAETVEWGEPESDAAGRVATGRVATGRVATAAAGIASNEEGAEGGPSSFAATAAAAARPVAESEERGGRWPGGVPEYYRSQVAELADLAQCIELSHDVLSRDPEARGDELKTLGRDVRRLVDFSRSLRHFVSPPPLGRAAVDVGELIEGLLGELVGRGVEMPRVLFRNRPGLVVRASRAALLEAFSACLHLVFACSRADEVVRVRTRLLDEAGRACVEFGFPAGPLKGRPASDLAQPYSLRRELPELPPNALAAAIALFRAQGAAIAVRGEPQEPGRLSLRVTIPLARPAGLVGQESEDAGSAD